MVLGEKEPRKGLELERRRRLNVQVFQFVCSPVHLALADMGLTPGVHHG